METLSPSQLRIVLAHEGIHIDRKDHFFKALAIVMDLFWYFWPISKKLSAHFEVEMELSCDDSLLTSGFF